MEKQSFHPEGFKIPENYFEEFKKGLDQRITSSALDEKHQDLGFTSDSGPSVHLDQLLAAAKKEEEILPVVDSSPKVISMRKTMTYISAIAAVLCLGFFAISSLTNTSSNVIAEISQEQIKMSTMQDEVIAAILEEDESDALDVLLFDEVTELN